MTSTRGVALGDSTSWPRDMPKACAIRKATARVGLARERSISDSIERETPQAADISSRVQPLFFRRSRTRSQSVWPTGSLAVEPPVSGLDRFTIGFHYTGTAFR